MNRAAKAPKKIAPQNTQKRAKVTKVAKKPVTKRVVTASKRTITTTSATPSFSLPQQQQKVKQQQSRFVSQPSTLVPQSLLTTTTRSFRSTPRVFNEPAPTGPAAIDDVSPKVQKIVQDILTLNIMESLQLTKALKKEFGYSDAAFAMAAPVAAAAAPAAAAAEEDKPKAAAKTSFNIKLESYDAASKVKIIKEVRTITGLGLKEAKELVDGAPQILKKEVKKDEAEAIVKLLKETGAVCILE